MRLRSLARSIYERSIGLKPRCDLPYATHLPVLSLAMAVFRPARIIEFGTGGYSTHAFVDGAVFPWVERVVAYENNREWFDITAGTLSAHPIFSVHFVDGPIKLAATRQNLADADLIFLDDSALGAERAQTIRAVAAVCGTRPLVVIHDYEVMPIRAACRAFEHRVGVKAWNPQCCLAWNGDAPRLQRVQALARLLERECGGGAVTHLAHWAGLAELLG